jgi:ketosteroid isomerase-like protein
MKAAALGYAALMAIRREMFVGNHTQPTRKPSAIFAMSLLLAVLTTGAGARQDASAAVRKAIDDSLLAGQAKNVAYLTQYLADDLRWVMADGTVVGKKERIAGATDGGRGPTLENVDIEVAGDTALVVMTGLFSRGDRLRMVETLVRREGRWQLVLHASVATK